MQLASLARDAIAAWALDPAGEDPDEVMATVLLGFADRYADRARLLFEESLALGGEARAQRDALVGELAAMVDRAWHRRGVDAEGPDVPALVVVGGIFRLLARPGSWEQRGTAELLEVLRAWVRSYWVPAGGARWRLARGLAGVSWVPTVPARLDLSAGDERERIAQATAHLLFQRGVAALSLPEIVALADSSDDEFHRYFGDAHDAAMAALELSYERTLATGVGAFLEQAPWAQRICNAAGPLNDRFRTAPALMHLAFVEAQALGPDGALAAHDRLMPFTLMLEEGYAQTTAALALPRAVSGIVAAAMYELCYIQASHLHGRAIPEYLPHRLYLCLAPFIGPEEASTLVGEGSGGSGG